MSDRVFKMDKKRERKRHSEKETTRRDEKFGINVNFTRDKQN